MQRHEHDKEQQAPRSPKTTVPLPTTKLIMNLYASSPEEQDAAIAEALEKEESFPSEVPIKETAGKKIGLMWPRTFSTSHPAAPLLDEYANKGCPVECGPDWTSEHIQAAMKRGNHTSANSKRATTALRTATATKVKNSYARVVKWKMIKDNIPAKLKISPGAMIPHKSRDFRFILDLSFRLLMLGKRMPSVNSATTEMAPKEAMVQLGLALKRLIAVLAAHRTRGKPFKFSKLDIKDGFWRMAVSDEDAWNFCYVLPSENGETDIDEMEIVVPNALQMGWCESPPFFCAASETARDTIQELLTSDSLPEHIFEGKMMDNAVCAQGIDIKADTTTVIEVFVDDFIGMTNGSSEEHLRHVSRAMLHGVHSIYPPPNVTGHDGEDPVAQKKLDNGDGDWAFVKEILGWIIDGENFTIQLPPEKCDKIAKLIKTICKSNSCHLKKFQVLAGKLQHASYGIPGGAGLFSPIDQAAIRAKNDIVIIDASLKATLQDWRALVNSFKTTPTPIGLLVAEYPTHINYTDACGIGGGGVVTPGLLAIANTVWQFEWPEDIKEMMRKHILTINDLELAAMVMGWLVLEYLCSSLKFCHVGTFCDNTSAVSWATKMRTSKSIAAARLLRFLSLRQRTRQASSILPLYIIGDDNEMADVPSRAFNDGKFAEVHSDLISYFNTHFPLPQNASWKEFQVPKSLSAPVISCLRGEQLPMEQLTRLKKLGRNTGATGQNIAEPSASIPSCDEPKDWKQSSLQQDSLPRSGQALTENEIKSKFKESRKRSQPSPRPSNWLENKVRSTRRRTRTSSQSNDS